MRLKSLTLRNVRLFGNESQTISFDAAKPVTIILGNNGSGKSTILDAASIMLSAFTGSFPGNSEKLFTDADIHVDDNNTLSDYLSCKAVISADTDYEIERYRRGISKAPQPQLKSLRTLAESLLSRLKTHEVGLPILAYYGTNRTYLQTPARRTYSQARYNRWDCYNSALDSATEFKRFFSWFDNKEDEERREKERRKDFSYIDPVLDAVRQAINRLLSGKYSNPRIDIRPLRFDLDELGPNGEPIRTLRLEQFSDGYKIIVAMVADIASRMAEGNPQMTNPLQAKGIVMIDEVDLHLHPQWQRSILNDLHGVFPNVQFIVTTHSPLIVLGATEIAQVVRLQGNRIVDNQMDISRMDVGQILLTDLFGLKSVYSPEYDQLFRRHQELLSNFEHLTPDEQTELTTLDGKLRRFSYGQSLEDLRMNKLIQQIADQLNISVE